MLHKTQKAKAIPEISQEVLLAPFASKEDTSRNLLCLGWTDHSEKTCFRYLIAMVRQEGLVCLTLLGLLRSARVKRIMNISASNLLQ